jgi:CubicO group peptidase (beta-lactamase class C family)
MIMKAAVKSTFIMTSVKKAGVFLLALLASPYSWAQPELPYQNMLQASEYAEEKGGVAVLVLQNDSIIFEDYHNGADSTVATHIFSATKGFWSLAAAAALGSGLIDSYEEPVAATITEWQDAERHPFKNLIKVKHLLSLSSGLSQDIENIQGLDAAAPDLYQYTVDSLDLNFLPGNRFQYGPSHYYAFAVFLERKLQQAGIHQDPLEYLDSLVFQPIGLAYDDWARDSAGNPHIPNGCYINPRQWMKFGRLFLNKGRWDGAQLVDSALIEGLLVADGPNLGHGRFLWLNQPDGYGAYPIQSAPPGSAGGFMYHNGYPGIIGALGAGKNRMYIIPSLRVVALRQTFGDVSNFDDHTFLSYLLQDVVVSNQSYKRETSLRLYPNPVQRWLWVDSGPLYEQAVITSLDGRRVYASGFDVSKPIDLSGLPSGLYVLQLRGEQAISSCKFVKQ